MSIKTAVVTGANSGIGFETALQLAKDGWKVGLVSRNLERGTEAIQKISEESQNQDLKLFLGDLSLESDCLRVAKEIQEWTSSLDVLVNNAGVYNTRKNLTSEGIEGTIALNHLGYYRLTLGLLSLLKKSAKDRPQNNPVRIINVSSGAHGMGKINLDQLADPTKYRGFKVYGDSKLANIYFTQELVQRLGNSISITVNSLHPGFVGTNFGKQEFPSFGSRMFALLMNWFAITPREGAQTSLWLAQSPDAAQLNGTYCTKSNATKTAPITSNVSIQKALWEWSVEKSPNTPKL